MSKVTLEQKRALAELSKRYSPPVYAIVARGADDEIRIQSREEAALIDEFANNICSLVLKDHPNYTGRDADINADAELVVHLVAGVLAEQGFEIP